MILGIVEGNPFFHRFFEVFVDRMDYYMYNIGCVFLLLREFYVSTAA